MSLLRSYLSSTVVQSVQVQVGGAGGGVGVVAGVGAGVGVRAGVGRGVLLAGVWYLFLFGAMLLRGRWSRILTS